MAARERSTAAIAGTLVALHALPSISAHCPPLADALGVRLELELDHAAALTFDDGPHPFGTPAILDALDEADAKATFFLVGEQVERRPALAREIVERGHEIGLHCQRHRNQLRLTPRQILRDIERAEQAIVDATGVSPQLYRPPYGALAMPALLYARRRGWTTLLWSAWGRDWRAAATEQTITTDVARDLRGGSVVLLHDSDFYASLDSWRRTLDAVPRIAALAGERGLDLVPAGAASVAAA